MAHAKKEHLEGLQDLLNQIREIPGLKEKSHGCFYHKSKSVLHFHVETHPKVPRLFAHVFDGKTWQEVGLSSSMPKSKQRHFASLIAKQLPLS